MSRYPTYFFLYLCVYVCVVCVVVGEKEQLNKTVNVRTRDNQVHGEHLLEDLIPRLLKLRKTRAVDDSKEFSKE